MESCAQNPTYKRARYSYEKRVPNVKRPRNFTPSYEYHYEIPEVSEITKVTKISESEDTSESDIISEASDASEVTYSFEEKVGLHNSVIEKAYTLFFLKLFITIPICFYLLGLTNWSLWVPKSHWIEF